MYNISISVIALKYQKQRISKHLVLIHKKAISVHSSLKNNFIILQIKQTLSHPYNKCQMMILMCLLLALSSSDD